MAATITWSAGPYRHETAGKGFIDKVEYRLTSVDGETEDASVYGSVTLDRPEDADMEDRSTFATQAKLIAAIKEKLGTEGVTEAESASQNAVAALKAPVHSYATAES